MGFLLDLDKPVEMSWIPLASDGFFRLFEEDSIIESTPFVGLFNFLNQNSNLMSLQNMESFAYDKLIERQKLVRSLRMIKGPHKYIIDRSDEYLRKKKGLVSQDTDIELINQNYENQIPLSRIDTFQTSVSNIIEHGGVELPMIKLNQLLKENDGFSLASPIKNLKWFII